MNTIYQMPEYAVQQQNQPKPSSITNYTNAMMKRPGGRNKANLPKPKRATSAYVYFSQHYREMLKRDGKPVPRISEFGKECAAKWNVMTETEKQPFAKLAATDKARYAEEIAAIKPKRDANKPKRPGTAFMLFMVDFRKEMAGKEPAGGVAAMAKLGGERWRKMTDSDKKPYVDSQNVEKTKYDISMEQYKSKVGNAASPQLPPQVTAATVAKTEMSRPQQQQSIAAMSLNQDDMSQDEEVDDWGSQDDDDSGSDY